MSSPVAKLPSPIMKLYTDFVQRHPSSEQQLQTTLQDVLTPNANPFHQRSRHYHTWLHLQKMYLPTSEGLAALQAEVSGSDGDFSDTARLEMEVKTELFKRQGVGGVTDAPLGNELVSHYALLYGL